MLVRNLDIDLGWSQVNLEQDSWKLELRKFIDDTDRRITDLNNWIESLTVPEYTTTERDALDSPQNGQMIYNSTTNRIEIRQADGWKYLNCNKCTKFVMAESQTEPVGTQYKFIDNLWKAFGKTYERMHCPIVLGWQYPM